MERNKGGISVVTLGGERRNVERIKDK